MTAPRLDVVGIGNAIVDIIGRCDDAFLARYDAPKGHMRLVDTATLMGLYGAMGPGIEISGGSAANTIAGIASLGGSCGFIGKTGDDEFGRIFSHDIRAQGVAFTNTPIAGAATSRSLILVTPDGERTMNTFLGVSTELAATDLDAALIGRANVVYLEGYLFDGAGATAAFEKAATLARAGGGRVALSLSDSFCVDRHRDALLGFMRAHVDILFANESEIIALYQTADFAAAAQRAAGDVALAALTRGAQGSVILHKGQTITVPVHKVDKVVDTTGAGDLYAGGFLFGLARGLALDTCGQLGGLAAAEVISHLGARPESSLAKLAAAAQLG